MTRFDVVGFGALNVDKLFKVNKIARKDEESFVSEGKESCGGSAANTIVGLARLGLKTGYVGKVSGDREGQFLLDDFKKERVDSSGVSIAEEGRSGVVTGFVDNKGQRALYVDPGVNDTITLDEVSSEYVGNTKFLHLTSFVGWKTFETQKKIVEQLPKRVKTSFDPGMLYAEKGLSALKPLVKRAYAMLPNQAELRQLIGGDVVDDAKKLVEEGVKVVAVKLGHRGCYVTNGKESHTIHSFEVKAVDTTGAGDAWNTGFLYGILKNKSLRECGRLGNFVASRCIMKMGARTGLPKLADLHRQELSSLG